MAVIEGHDIGGTCVNRGCVPSKALLAASGRVRDFKNQQHLKALGIQVWGAWINGVVSSPSPHSTLKATTCLKLLLSSHPPSRSAPSRLTARGSQTTPLSWPRVCRATSRGHWRPSKW